MAKGCLAALFGIGLNGSANGGPNAGSNAQPGSTNGGPTSGGMSEGDVHSGPGGYEGMGYSGGYAADYRAGAAEPDDSGFEEGEA
jgi:hypothetical protein